MSANAKGRLTASATARAGTKVGVSDPVIPCGRVIAQRIKGTLGITGLSRPRVHIDGAVWHLDVGLSHPGAGEGPKGPAVRDRKSTRLNSSHGYISYAVFCLKKKKPYTMRPRLIAARC